MERTARQPGTATAESAYLGTYQNSYYGPLTVASDGGALNMSMGPPDSPTKFVLTPFDGNTFTFDTIGENADGPSGAEFTLGPDGLATSVTLTFYDKTGLGTFTRSARPGSARVAIRMPMTSWHAYRPVP